MNKIKIAIFSISIITSLMAIVNENIEFLKSKDNFELSKNRRDVEVVNNYHLSEIEIDVFIE